MYVQLFELFYVQVEDTCCFTERELYYYNWRKEKKTEDMTGEVFEQKNELAMENLFLALDDSYRFNMAEEKTVKGIARYLWRKINVKPNPSQ